MVSGLVGQFLEPALCPVEVGPGLVPGHALSLHLNITATIVMGKMLTRLLAILIPVPVSLTICIILIHKTPEANFVSVDGQWGSWQAGACSVSCDGGTRLKTRSCDSPPPQHEGNNCPGASSEMVACNTQSCPSIHTLF